MDTTISNTYRRFIYFCFLPLALLPFAWVIGRELAINMIVSSPHRDYSIRLPFDLSHSFYLAAMCLFLGLGASCIKALLDNSPETNLYKKLAYGFTALSVFILNACFMITSFSMSEILVYIVLPVTITIHLISLRRERLFENATFHDPLFTESEPLLDDAILRRKPVTLSLENGHYKASLKFTTSALFNAVWFDKNSALKYLIYALIGVCYLPLCMLAVLSLPVLLTTLAAYIEPDLLDELSRFNYWGAVIVMYGFTLVGLSSLAKMLSIHFRAIPVPLVERLGLTLMYLLGLSNLLMMWNSALEISSHHLIVLSIFGPPVVATVLTGIYCGFSIWRTDTISISEYFEMELGETLKNTTPPFNRSAHD